jgi:GNAT superfamily N-acetyltransferase
MVPLAVVSESHATLGECEGTLSDDVTQNAGESHDDDSSDERFPSKFSMPNASELAAAEDRRRQLMLRLLSWDTPHLSVGYRSDDSDEGFEEVQGTNASEAPAEGLLDISVDSDDGTLDISVDSDDATGSQGDECEDECDMTAPSSACMTDGYIGCSLRFGEAVISMIGNVDVDMHDGPEILDVLHEEGCMQKLMHVRVNIRFESGCHIADSSAYAQAVRRCLDTCSFAELPGCMLLPHTTEVEPIRFVGRRCHGSIEHDLWLRRTTGAALDNWKDGVSTCFEILASNPAHGDADCICKALLCYRNTEGGSVCNGAQPTLEWIAVRQKYQSQGFGRHLLLEIELFLRRQWPFGGEYFIWNAAGCSIAPHPNAMRAYPSQAFFDAMGFEFEHVLKEEAKRIIFRGDAVTQVVCVGHEASGSLCAICLTHLHPGDRVTRLECIRPHYFHANCAALCLRERGVCPICKRGITSWTEARHLLTKLLTR